MTTGLLILLVIGMGLFIFLFFYGKNDKEDILDLNNESKVEKTAEPEILKIKHFGEININYIENDYYKNQLNINGREVQIDLNFNEYQIQKNAITLTNKFIDNISEIAKNCDAKILAEYKNGKVVKGYIENHIAQFTEEDFKQIGISINDSPKTKKNKFLNKIYLKRIGFYPEDPDSFVIFDYTIGRSLTQYLIVLQFDENGNFVDLYTES